MNVMIISSFIFSIGYLFVVMEHYVPKIHKSAVVLCSSFFIWAILIGRDYSFVGKMDEVISDIFQVLFFLMGALTLVEYIDNRNGFCGISAFLSKWKGSKLIAIISFTSFVLSSVLDNMTTCIMMCLLVKEIIKERKHRWYLMSSVLMACNTGGAFTPIGDITTTMLWLKGLISTKKIIMSLAIPCIVSSIAGTVMICLLARRHGDVVAVKSAKIQHGAPSNIPLFAGVGALVSVPIMKQILGLPPFLTIMGAVGIAWLIDENVVKEKYCDSIHKKGFLNKVMETDLSTVLFFYGILLGVSGLFHSGALNVLTSKILELTSSYLSISYIVGILSAMIDNVPIVSAMTYMFDYKIYAIDNPLWLLLAFTAGVGGNMLILGSAAGVALLGIEQIPFVWYLTRITPVAFVAYNAGIIAFVIQQMFI